MRLRQLPEPWKVCFLKTGKIEQNASKNPHSFVKNRRVGLFIPLQNGMSENLMAYSSAGNNEGAYSLANGAISDYSDAIDQNIEGVMGEFKQRTDTLKNSMNETAIFTKL